MNFRLVFTAILIVVLAGCQEQKQTVTLVTPGSDQLIYSYPTHEQNQVPVTAPVLLHFSTPVTNESPGQAIVFERLQGGESFNVDFSVHSLSNGQTLLLKPEEKLLPGQRFRIRAEGLVSGQRAIDFPAGGIQFASAARTQGPLSEQLGINAAGPREPHEFRVLEVLPSGDPFPITDFASLRLRFSEPLKTDTLSYGESLTLTDSQGALIPAELYVQGHNLTVDPDNNLTPGESYTLSLSSAVSSRLGGQLDQEGFEFSFVARDSETDQLLPLEVISDDNGNRLLQLTGDPFNSVQLSSGLLGPDNRTFLGRTAPGELANHVFFDLSSVVAYPDITPFQVVKDTQLTGTNVVVEVAGEQPAGLESGEIDVRFLNDATGFLISNPYSTSSSAPRNMLIFADLSLTTGDSRANGALSQSLLNVPLVGTVSLDDGVITINVAAVIAPEILALEQASGLVSIRLKGYESPADGPSPADFPNNDAPFVRASATGENVKALRPGDPLRLFFNEPVSDKSAREGITLVEIDTQSGAEQAVPFELRSNGPVISLYPQSPLRHGQSYRLRAENVRDLAGNALSVPFTQTFRLAPTEQGTSTSQSPIALTTFPGFPCARPAVDPGENATTQGRCLGGRMADDDRPDDLIPIKSHAGNRPITVRFSQNMDPQTLVKGTSVTMEKRTDNGWESFQDWQLEISPREIRLVPLSRWEQDTLYRYSLHSDQENSANAIRSEAGLPLQTRILNQTPRDFTPRDFGGPVLTNHFRGGPVSEEIPTPLRNLPSNDANADLVLNETTEEKVPENDQGQFQAISNSAKIIVSNLEGSLVNDARIGCDPNGTDCPQDKFIYLTGMLDVDLGPDPVATLESRPVPVFVHPSMLYTSGEEVHIDSDAGDTVEPTGPMAMRLRFANNGNGRQDRIAGLIANNPETGELEISLSLDVYLDAPYLEIVINGVQLDHNIYSLPLDNLALKGPINFLDDGRLQIELSNPDPVDIVVQVEGDPLLNLGSSEVTLTIPPEELVLNYVSPFDR